MLTYTVNTIKYTDYKVVLGISEPDFTRTLDFFQSQNQRLSIEALNP